MIRIPEVAFAPHTRVGGAMVPRWIFPFSVRIPQYRTPCKYMFVNGAGSAAGANDRQFEKYDERPSLVVIKNSNENEH